MFDSTPLNFTLDDIDRIQVTLNAAVRLILTDPLTHEDDNSNNMLAVNMLKSLHDQLKGHF